MPGRVLRFDVKGRAEFLAPASLNLGSLGTYAATIALALPGFQHGGEVNYVTERRLVASEGKFALAGEGALTPQSVAGSDSVIAGTATFSYVIAWRSPENDRARGLLEDAGCYRTRGGPTHPYAQRYCHWLKVEARNEKEAIARPQLIIEESGGDSSDLTVMRQDPDRLRLLGEVIERVWAEAKGPNDSRMSQ